MFVQRVPMSRLWHVLKCRALMSCMVHCSTGAVSLRENLGSWLTSRIAAGRAFYALSISVVVRPVVASWLSSS